MVPHEPGVWDAVEKDYRLPLSWILTACHVVPVNDVVVAGRIDEVVGEAHVVQDFCIAYKQMGRGQRMILVCCGLGRNKYWARKQHNRRKSGF